MASTAHFPDPVCFQQQSNEFISWLTGKPGVRMNSKIRLTDLTSLNAGRGVGTCPLSPQNLSLRLHCGSKIVSFLVLFL